MKILAILTFSFLMNSSGFAQSGTDEEAVTRASLNYIEGFYEGDTLKLKESLKPSLLKYGYWKDRETGKYGDEIYMSFEGAKDYARGILEQENFPASNTPKDVEVLDLMNHIAVTKITAWWGVDYLLLSKVEGKWMIGQVLWEGPLEKE